MNLRLFTRHSSLAARHSTHLICRSCSHVRPITPTQADAILYGRRARPRHCRRPMIIFRR